MSLRRLLSPAVLAVLFAVPAVAQVAPAPSPTPGAPATIPAEASAVPPPIAITLPTPTPTPVLTQPASSSTTAPRARPTPAPAASATPRVTPTPTPTPTPIATATAAGAPQASATPLSPPSSSSTIGATANDALAAPVVPPAIPAPALPIPPERGSAWMLPTVGGLLIAIVLVALAARRRRRAAETSSDVKIVSPPPPLEPRIEPAAVVPPVVPETPATPRAWLSLDLRARRAGVNLLTATLDAEIVVRNEGEAPATDVRVVLRLLSARADQDAELAAAVADPAARPATAPFVLAPGEERAIATIATLPRGDIAVMTVGERPMFVPVAALGVRYRSGAVAGETSTAFALGVERQGSDKLGPVWLDAPSRMHDAVGVRPHGTAIRR